MNWQSKPIATLITTSIATLYLNVLFCEEVDRGGSNNHKTLQIVDMNLTFASVPISKNKEQNQQSITPEAMSNPQQSIKKSAVSEAPKLEANIKKQLKRLVSVPVKKTPPVKKIKVELATTNDNRKPNEKDIENNSKKTAIEKSSE